MPFIKPHDNIVANLKYTYIFEKLTKTIFFSSDILHNQSNGKRIYDLGQSKYHCENLYRCSKGRYIGRGESSYKCRQNASAPDDEVDDQFHTNLHNGFDDYDHFDSFGIRNSICCLCLEARFISKYNGNGEHFLPWGWLDYGYFSCFVVFSIKRGLKLFQ
jgi:hypothetical protein